MYKKKISDKFKKDGYKVSLLDIDYKDVSICLVDIKNARKTYCKIKNSPIYYYIVEGKGEFLNRIMNSDIEYPIDIMENKGKYVILDGLHRLVKCKLLGNPKVNVRIIPRTEIPNISK